MLGAAAKNFGTQNIFLGAPGYRAPVGQQPLKVHCNWCILILALVVSDWRILILVVQTYMLFPQGSAVVLISCCAV